jgi:hypothetical protein
MPVERSLCRPEVTRYRAQSGRGGGRTDGPPPSPPLTAAAKVIIVLN